MGVVGLLILSSKCSVIYYLLITFSQIKTQSGVSLSSSCSGAPVKYLLIICKCIKEDTVVCCQCVWSCCFTAVAVTVRTACVWSVVLKDVNTQAETVNASRSSFTPESSLFLCNSSVNHVKVNLHFLFFLLAEEHW